MAPVKKAAAAGATFGDHPSFQSSDNATYALSDDKKAFTITFNPAFEASVANAPTATDPIATTLFSVVIPVTGKNINTTFFVTTFVSAEAGAGGAIAVIVNDKQTVTRFSGGQQKEVIVKLKYAVRSASDIRLTILLLAEHDAAHPKSAALVNVTSIDTDLAIANKKKGGKKGKK